MSWCECYECKSDISQLRDEVRSLEWQVEALKQELRAESDERRDALRAVWDELAQVRA